MQQLIEALTRGNVSQVKRRGHPLGKQEQTDNSGRGSGEG
jgi:hypothetical protein